MFMTAGTFFSLFPSKFRLWIRNNSKVIEKIDYEKHSIYLSIDSEVESSFRTKSCFHEPGTVEWIEMFITEGDIFFDVGANVGAYSLITGVCKHGKTKVYAFEPNFASYAKLCDNIILNKCEGFIYPFPIALSSHTRIDNFNYSSFQIGSAYHVLDDAAIRQFTPIYRQPIITYSLDQLIKMFHIPFPQHIKIDVDGTEFSIVKGASETLSDKRFKSLNIEVNEALKESRRMINHIASFGLTLYNKYNDAYAEDPNPKLYRVYNYIFINKHNYNEKAIASK